jgi:prepilin-type processing-associated H-X9-DG protein
VVVVLGVIAILATLLLVGLQSARESARRTACINNLRQIGVAILRFESRNGGELPRGIDDRGYSFLVSILPDLESEPLYNSINFQLGNGMFVNLVNSTASGNRIATYTCPSETPPPGLTSWTNYAGNRGVGYQVRERYTGPLGGSCLGAFYLRDIRDGTSSTALAAESMVGTFYDKTRHPVRTVFDTPYLPLPQQHAEFIQACANLDPAQAKLNAQRKGHDWMHGEFGRSLYNHDVRPNGHTCNNGGLVQHGAWTASSQHPGGTNLVYADGHVVFMRTNTSLAIWHAIGSMNGGEALADPY